jgi:hypothetical protein
MPLDIPMTALCRQRFIQHAIIVLGVVGLLTLAYWDSSHQEDDVSFSPAWMLTGGGIVDQLNDAGVVTDLTLWVPVNVETAAMDLLGSEDVFDDDDASQGATYHDEKDRLLIASWTWEILDNISSNVDQDALVSAIPGCPHCGQIDDDDVYISEEEMEPEEPTSMIKWKVFSLKPVFHNENNCRQLRSNDSAPQHRHCTQAYCDNRMMRWHLHHNKASVEEKLCKHFSKLMKENAHGLLPSWGKVSISMDENMSSMHDRGKEDAFLWAQEQIQDAVYGEDRNWPTSPVNVDKQQRNDIPMEMFGAKCSLHSRSFNLEDDDSSFKIQTNLKNIKE